MGHLCGSTCKRKTGKACQTCRTPGGAQVVRLDANGKPVNPPTGKYRQANPHKMGAAADMYFDGLSYRRTAENIGQCFDRETAPASVYRWVKDLTEKADGIAKPMKVTTGNVWIADEVVAKVSGKNYWLFNVMDSDSRFVPAAYLSPVRTARAAATTALAPARERADNPPRQIKTDGLRSYAPGNSGG